MKIIHLLEDKKLPGAVKGISVMSPEEFVKDQFGDMVGVSYRYSIPRRSDVKQRIAKGFEEKENKLLEAITHLDYPSKNELIEATRLNKNVALKMIDDLVDKDMLDTFVGENGEILYGLSELGKKITNNRELQINYLSYTLPNLSPPKDTPNLKELGYNISEFPDHEHEQIKKEFLESNWDKM